MFRDMQLSKEMHSEFTNNDNNTIATIELASIQVLTNGNWPIEEGVACAVPPILKQV